MVLAGLHFKQEKGGNVFLKDGKELKITLGRENE